jgi:hypothetical protein
MPAFPCLDRHVLARMTTSRQPFLHGPDHYDRIAAGPGVPALPLWDPQGVVEAPTLEARIEASGVIGSSDQERRDARRQPAARIPQQAIHYR